MRLTVKFQTSNEFDVESASWQKVNAYLEKDNRIILPVGSQEQHGSHLPLGVDWMIPYAMGHLISENTGVFCASPVCYGMAWLHSGFPGTIALKPGTLIALYTDIIEEMHASGFRRILLLNGHGGNGNALNAAFSMLVRQFNDLRVKVFEWWRLPPVIVICEREFGEIDSHAGAAETSVMLHIYPGSVAMEEAKANASEFLPYFPNPAQIREMYPDGVMQNDPTRASAAVGQEIVDACVDLLSEEVEVGGPNGNW